MGRGAVNRRREGGFILAFAAVVLMVSASLALHLLAESAGRTRAATAAWADDRLEVMAGSGARRVLADFSDGRIPEEDASPDAAAPHIVWAGEWSAPDGSRLSVRITDAQRRFDFNNLVPLAETGAPDREAVRIASELLAAWGDPDPALRVAALVRGLTPEPDAGDAPDSGSGESGPALEWHAVLALPEFSVSDMQGTAVEEPRPPLSGLAGFLPGRDGRPLPVNINTADEHVILALLGRDQRVAVERVLAARRVRPFDSVEAAAGMSGLAADRLAAVRPWATTESHWFEIEAKAEMNGRSGSVWALVHRDPAGQEARVRRWAYAR